MFYDRKIKYLDYYENGGRIKGCGFAKMEVRDGNLRVELAIAGLHSTDSFERDVMLCAGNREKAIGKIMIYGGKGQYRQVCVDLHNLGNTGISYEELNGIRISIGTGREVSCRWTRPGTADRMIQEKGTEITQSTDNAPKASGAQRAGSAQEADNNPKASGAQRAGSTQEADNNPKASGAQRAGSGQEADNNLKASGAQRAGSGQEADNNPKASGAQRAGSTQEADNNPKASGAQADRTQSTYNMQKVSSVQGTISIQEEMETAKRAAGNRVGLWSNEMEIQNMEQDVPKERGRIPVKLMEDKWSQLWAIYPHVRPFRDGREYLSVGPADFVLFPSEAYKMVNNSFLLHGYYNYGHLILTRIEKKGEAFYYVGVPGNYFEREKQVAVMFGFESFECAEEPAQTGDFGYYMMRTQL